MSNILSSPGPEIWYQTDGAIDFLVGGVGTGGTLTGCTQFLKSKNPSMKTIAVEPAESPVIRYAYMFMTIIGHDYF
jgi:cysteine synthase A